MQRLVFVSLVMLLLGYVQPGIAAEKITVDPNASGTQVETSIPKGDERLAQKVTYEARGKTVLSVLNDLTEQTGVTFRAGYAANDWQVRDRKMNIFAKDVPLADLMSSIARVMKFKWQINDKESKTPSYRLYMDRKSLLDADAQKARRDARRLELRTKQRNKVIEEYMNADSLSQQDLARLKLEKPFSYVLASTGIAGALGEIITAFPPMGEAIATGQELTISVSQLPPEGQQGVLNYFKGMNNFGHLDPKHQDIFPASVDGVTLNLNMGNLEDVEIGRIGLQFGETIFSSSLIDPDGKLAKAIGKAFVDLEDGKGGSFDDMNHGTAPEMQSAMISDMESIDPGEPVNQHPDDPALLQKVKIESKSNRLQDVEAAFAASSGFAVVSDSFGKAGCYGDIPKDEVEIKTLLDKITELSYYNWDKRKSIIEFRDRSWFAKRSAQIPDAQIEAWRQAFKLNETLDINELAQIAVLTQEQININIEGDEVLSCLPKNGQSITTLIGIQQYILRAYNALSKSERGEVFSSSGLDIRELSPERRALVEKAINCRNAGFLKDPDSQVILQGERVQQGKQLAYTLKASAGDGIEPITWFFKTPKYEPPKKEEPAKQDLPVKDK